MTTKKSGSGSKAKKRSGSNAAASQAAPKQRWLRVAGILLLAVWMFVLGVLVGRGTAPVRFDIQKLQKELATLKAAALKREQPPQESLADGTQAPGGIDPTDLEFYEDLRASRSRLNFKPAPVKKTPHKSTAPVAAPARKPFSGTTADRKATAEKAVQHTPKTAKRMTTKKPAATHKAAKEGPSPAAKASHPRQQLTIQVASVKNPQLAERMVRDLKRKGYPAYTRIGKVPGKGIWYRVRVGRFSSRQAAVGMQARLRRDKWKAVIVSQ